MGPPERFAAVWLNLLSVKIFVRLVDNMIRVREEPGYIRDSITSRPVMIEKVK